MLFIIIVATHSIDYNFFRLIIYSVGDPVFFVYSP